MAISVAMTTFFYTHTLIYTLYSNTFVYLHGKDGRRRRLAVRCGIVIFPCACVDDQGIKTFPMTRVAWTRSRWQGARTRATGHLSPRAEYKYIYNMACIGKALTRMSPEIPTPHTNNVFMCARRRNDFHSDSSPQSSYARFFFFIFIFMVPTSHRFFSYAGRWSHCRRGGL